MELKLTKDNFQKEVMEVQDKLVLVDFWATWCPPCRAVSPVVAELAEEYEGKVVVGKVNVDEEPELAAEFHVTNIPCFFFIKNGSVVKQTVGAHTFEEFSDMIESLL